ncbi:ankyrin repeat domain-containing protein [Stenotrophomonas sp. Sm6012]|uniref:ankyrin repeat domain-containing protein n=1 Tax=Stenotrophomonas sp. Sm6012 TaxID=3002745 RepID=UPI0027E44D43|nr:ankyrin repeat domain-containing protein [Stenotrophomonas sp. Sm6012]MDQ7280540.1 ankyrin repeat domain-containing protein [Stenotrophomonas sp. Sm6012]
MTKAHRALLDLVRERTGPTHPNYTALLRARGDVRAMAHVLGVRGVDPDSSDLEGSTILHQPDVSYGVVQLLLAAGADPDARWYGGHGRTPLYFATVPGVPTLLYEAGADLEHRDVSGLTPLLFNIQYGAVDMVDELLGLGADDAVHDDAGLDVFDYTSRVPTQAIAEQLATILQRHRALRAKERREGLVAVVRPGLRQCEPQRHL